MKLYGSRTSPYVRKARAALVASGLPFQFHVCDVWSEGAVIAAMNPLGKVPVLETDDGGLVFDSFAIIDHVDNISGGKLIPAETDARRAVLWWHALGHGVIDACVAEVLERRRSRDLQSDDHITRERTRAARALAAAEARVDGTAFLSGPQFTLADITLAVALEYIDFRIAVAWRNDHPALARWLAEASRRPSLAETGPPRD